MRTLQNYIYQCVTTVPFTIRRMWQNSFPELIARIFTSRHQISDFINSVTPLRYLQVDRYPGDTFVKQMLPTFKSITWLSYMLPYAHHHVTRSRSASWANTTGTVWTLAVWLHRDLTSGHQLQTRPLVFISGLIYMIVAHRLSKIHGIPWTLMVHYFQDLSENTGWRGLQIHFRRSTHIY